MANFLRTVEVLCLSLWLGSDVFLSFVVAPGAFRVLASRDQAGAMVGFSLRWMHMIGVICGIVFLLCRFLRTRSFSTLVAPAEFGATVTGYNHPSVKLKNHIGEGHIINTSSAAFIKATLRKH